MRRSVIIRYLILAAACGTTGTSARADFAGVPSVEWSQRFTGTPTPFRTDGQARKIAVDPSGDVVVSGESSNSQYDFYTAKYAASSGALIWEKRYDGPVHRDDKPAALGVDAQGNVIVVGSSSGESYYADIYIAKYASADGTLIWERRYTGSGVSSDAATAAVVDSAGNVVVTGASRTSGGIDFYTAKYSASDGTLIWERRYNGLASGTDQPVAVALDSVGNVFVTGTSYNGSNDDICTLKYAAVDGAMIWERRYNGPANKTDAPSAITVDSSGNAIVAGKTTSINSSAVFDFYVAKYSSSSGAVLWETTYHSSFEGDAIATALAVDAANNVVVTGSSKNSYGTDYYTAKYAAATGTLLWGKIFAGSASGSAMAVALDSGGNAIVTGYSAAVSAVQTDICTLKYGAADGAVLWSQRYDGPAGNYDRANSMAVDALGNVLVAGGLSDGSMNSFCTLKYAGGTGWLQWQKIYLGPSKSYDGAASVASDASGNVIVTGYVANGNNRDFYTAKYMAGTGVKVWERYYNGPANADDEAKALAVDSAGNVIVTGISNNGANNDFYTAKYAAANGALIWERRYNGSANADDQPKALALDSGGNVIVTGQSSAGNVSMPGEAFSRVNYDYYTAKYSAATGALLWEQRYSGPSNYFDIPEALVVDSSGDVIVTGASDNGTITQSTPNAFIPDPDCFTIKYSGISGSVIWSRRSTLSEGGTAIALDPSGNIAVAGGPYTAKYANSSGSVIWENLHGFGSSGRSVGNTITVDANGNVLVTATIVVGQFAFGTSGLPDFYIAKYESLTGNLVWSKVYSGVNGNPFEGAADYSCSIVTDANGNAAVLATSVGQIYASGYSSVDGSLLWELRRAGGTGETASAARMVKGPQDNLIVAGAIYGSVQSGSLDLATDILTFSIGIAPPRPPSITISGSAGALSYGSAAISFGGIRTGTTGAVQTCTITNTGDVALSIGALTVDGVNSGEFAVSSPGSSSIAPNSSATFTVAFSPSANGCRSAAIHLMNGDSGKSPFNIALTGVGLTPVESWRQDHFSQSNSAGLAADDVDPNKNGIPNLLEYALNGDPTGGTTGTAILPRIARGLSGALELSLTRFLDRNDVNLTVQASDSPSGTWIDLATSAAGGAFQVSTAGATVSESGSGNTRAVTVGDLYQVTNPDHPHRFMRLRVSRQ